MIYIYIYIRAGVQHTRSVKYDAHSQLEDDSWDVSTVALQTFVRLGQSEKRLERLVHGSVGVQMGHVGERPGDR
jgi:hypothetical protein